MGEDVGEKKTPPIINDQSQRLTFSLRSVRKNIFPVAF